MKKFFDVTKLTAYELVMQDDIKELNSVGYYLKHKKTGARVMLLLNDDNNKVFNIAFRTPVMNDTGVPHILEHSVLCGSKKYSAKDPFVELVKGSLNTFLNAMTYPDKTMYPVASCNDKDFMNLMDVYMDAVLNPNIYTRDEIFRQEGWNYHLDSEDGELTINGVVYNEMKGVMSSPDGVVSREGYHNLFPENTYSYESGGDPEFIPELTYEEFINFHKTYYHPSNSYIYLYGDVDANERLDWLDEAYLSKYDALEVNSSIPEHKSFDAPIEKEVFYAVGKDESVDKKTYFSYATVAGSVLEEGLVTAMEMLSYSILSMPGAPIQKALIDAGICEEVYGGLETVNQNIFTITAKNCPEDKKDEFVRIIDETLKKIVAEGINKDSLRAALNKKEFDFREADFGSYPKGLFYCMDMMDSWLYDDNKPFMYLKMESVFNDLREKIDTDYFEKLIEKYILNNNHKLILTTNPKKGLTEEKEEKLAKKLAEYKATLTEEEIKKMVADTKHLEQYQSEPSTKEQLEAIPLLKLEDIGKLPEKLYLEETDIKGVKTIYSEVPTNGIAYIRMSFDTKVLDMEELPYVPVLTKIIKKIDTKNYDYLSLNNVINLETGGIGLDTSIYNNVNDDKAYSHRLEISTKVLNNKIDKALELIKELVTNTIFDDKKRVKEIVAETKSMTQAYIMGTGHTVAVNRAMSYFSEDAYLSDMTGGIQFYKFIVEMDKAFETDGDAVIAKIKSVAAKVFNINNLILSVTAEKAGYDKFVENFGIVEEMLSNEKIPAKEWKFDLQQLNEGFKTSSQVQYVARTGDFKKAGFNYRGAMQVFANIMSYEYLWNNIRVKGGAYGCFGKSIRSGKVYFVSYRDPNLANTNAVYEGIANYLREFNAPDRDILKFIIGTISNLDTPRNARAKGSVAFSSYMSGVTYEDMVKEREEVLSLTNADINALADIMEAVMAQGNICVIGGASKIEQDKDLFKETVELFN